MQMGRHQKTNHSIHKYYDTISMKTKRRNITSLVGIGNEPWFQTSVSTIDSNSLKPAHSKDSTHNKQLLIERAGGEGLLTRPIMMQKVA